MKDVELKLISELMKNSRRSDRELAKVTGFPQPTISRTIRKLGKKGCIKEYTVMPDFHKLGYELAALTFLKLRQDLVLREIEKARKTVRKRLEKGYSLEAVMVARGTGLGYDAMVISFHKDYTAYMEFISRLSQFSFLASSETASFIISLNNEIKYRPLTFLTLAKYILICREKSKQYRG